MAPLYDPSRLGTSKPGTTRGNLEEQTSSTELPRNSPTRRERGEPPTRREPRSGQEFGEVQVSGQPDVPALDIEDILTFIAGAGVTITTHAANRSVTIGVYGGVVPRSLDDLDDVTITVPPSQDDILSFDATLGVWGAIPFPDRALDGLSDVDTTGLAVGDVLGWDGVDWGAVTPVTDLNSLTDVSVASPTSGNFLKWNGASWVDAAVPGGSTDLDGLTDVVISGTQTSGDVLEWDGVNWVDATPTVPAADLDGLTDVVISGTQTSGDVLEWDGANWVDATPTVPATDLDGLTDVVISGAQVSGDILEWDGADWVDVTPATPVTDLDGLTDVVLTAPAASDLLAYTGSGWINIPAPTIPTDLDGLTDVVITGSPSNGDLLEHNGTNWVNTTPAPPVIDLDGLTDVVISGTQTSGDVLEWDGANWVDVTPTPGVTTFSGLSDVSLGALTILDLVAWNGSAWVNIPAPTIPTDLDGLTDVVISGSPVNGDLLEHNGTNWVNTTPAPPVTTLAGLTDVDLTGYTTEDLLRYDGANWVPDTLLLTELENVALSGEVIGQVLTYVTGSRWENRTPAYGISDLVSDLSPQLGADLDTNGFLVDGRDVATDGVVTDALKTVRDNGLFMARKVTLQTTVVAYADIATWAATADIVDSDYSFNVTTGVLTINTTGVYRMDISMMGVLSASNRSELNLQVLRDYGIGYALVSNEAFAANYAARQSSENQGGVNLNGYLVSLTSGDLLKIQMQHATTAMRVRGYWSMQRLR